MAVVTIVIAMTGYGLAKGFRYYVKGQRKSLLEAPADLSEYKQILKINIL